MARARIERRRRRVAVRCVTALLAPAILCAALRPAAADWQYTQWGMTPDEVVAAADGAAHPNTDRNLDADGLRAELVAPWQGETVAFTAVFIFNARDKLHYVTLNPIGAMSCPAVSQTLLAHYGPPGSKARMGPAAIMRWDDVAGDNLVVYLDLGLGNCTVQYSKLPPTRPSGKGL